MKAIFSWSIFLFSFSLIAQDKVIVGDTANWRYDSAIHKEMGIKDLTQTKDDFVLRFYYFGQLVEITQNQNQLEGTAYFHIFRTKRKKKQTITKKETIDSLQLSTALGLFQKSGIKELPSMEGIEHWQQGFDGVTYHLDYATKDTIWTKVYWSPHPENNQEEELVFNFVDEFKAILQLNDRYNSFQDELPKSGCYNNGSMAFGCYIVNSVHGGYSGLGRLPYGFEVNTGIGYIGKTKLNIGAKMSYQTYHGNSNLELIFRKNNLFKNEKTGHSFFTTYHYFTKKMDFLNAGNRVENHQVHLGIDLKNNWDFGVGFDHIESEAMSRNAVLVSAYKYWSEPGLRFSAQYSFFKDEPHYRVGLGKTIHFRSNFFIRYFELGVNYQKFMDYKDLGFYLTIPLLSY